MHALVLGLVTLCAAAGAAPAAGPQAATEEAWTTASAQQVYDSLPEQEREPFLAYELALGLEQAMQKGLVVRTGQDSAPLAQELHDAYGIPDNLRRKFEKLPIPHDFHINMYGWVKKSTDPTFEEMMQLAARGHYCIRDTCFTLQEPFGNCCPF